MSYAPPFRITAKSINLIAEISACIERVKIYAEKLDSLRLRKINQMKTIRSSLAIEGNSLSAEQVTALIDGKSVVAPLKEVQEVKNAIAVYKHFKEYNPHNMKDLLKAHGIMMWGQVDSAGQFRKGDVCVAGKDGTAHIAPPSHRVQGLIVDLFDWLQKSDDHALVKSCVFHYEFEFIHLFEDGNGRMGRLWQSKILSEWNAIFENIPIENMIWENQSDYYRAIEESTRNTDSGFFVDFMLQMILRSLQIHLQNDTVNDTVNLILSLMKENPSISYDEIAEKTKRFRATISRKISELKKQGRVQRVGADKNGFWKVLG